MLFILNPLRMVWGSPVDRRHTPFSSAVPDRIDLHGVSSPVILFQGEQSLSLEPPFTQNPSSASDDLSCPFWYDFQF